MGARSKRISQIRDSREFGGLIAQLEELTAELHGASITQGGPVFHIDREQLESVWLATPIEVARDSDTITESNWQVITKGLCSHDKYGDGAAQVHRFSHWGCGWYERLYVRRDGAPVLRELQRWLNALADYPVANDDHHSNLEWERNHPGHYPGECYCGNDDCSLVKRELPWTAGVNVPGYLPESEVQRFETLEEAWDHLIEERERDCGEDEEAEPLERMDVPERGACSVHLSTPGSTSDFDLGRAYWIIWDGDH